MSMYKIMLADDEGIVIDSLKFIIEKEFQGECQIEYAKTGRSVIELAERMRPDIAIMDIQMPGINGIDAMKEIREANKHIIFIVMSAYDKVDYAKEAIKLGVLEYLNKPVDREKIVQVLRHAMAIIDKDRERRSQDLLIREKMETVVPIIENGLIQNLLYHEYFEEDIDNFKNLLGISENYAYMAVLVCGEEQVGNHMTNAVGASIRVQNAYREIREVTGGYLPGFMGAVMANKIPVLIPYRTPKLDYNERIQIIERSRELARKLKARVDVTFRVGIGSVKPLGEVSESYNEAINSLVQTTNRVAHVDDAPVGCQYEDSYPIETEKMLFELLEKGEVNGIIAESNHFFDWMEENYRDYENDIKLKVLEFALWAEHISYLNGSMVYHFTSRHDWLPTVMGLKEMSEIRSWFVDKMSDACRNVMAKKEERSISVVERARSYIDYHFNKDISLDDVSREVDISPYYFSKLFKEETGKNFVEYVTEIRMNRAKELLLGSDMSMKEICSAVGYADPNYFSRTFKKNMGVTPTEYKENH